MLVATRALLYLRVRRFVTEDPRRLCPGQTLREVESNMSRKIWTEVLGFGLLTTCVATPAQAHISLEKGKTQLSRYGDADTAIKEAPCGQAGGKRGTHVYTYEPGQTITVSLVEAIPHPSYFRFAFDNDGDDGFKDPVSILPIDPSRKCPTTAGGAGTDHCNKADYYNSPAVLPNMDDLLPHIPTLADTFTPPLRTFQVTLPNVECSNCTLQVIQVMEDDAFHGPFDTTPGVGVSDVYHQCIDLVLKRGASQGAGGAPNGGGGATGGAGTTGTSGTTGLGGTTTGIAGATGSSGAGTSVGGFPTGPNGAGGTAGAQTAGGGNAAVQGTGTPGVGGDGTPEGEPAAGDNGSCAVASPGRRAGSAAGWGVFGLALGYLALRRHRR
jgi:hypothetical protein